MKSLLALFALVFLISISITAVAQALSYPSGEVGQDISWPNCGNLKFEPASFGIVGVTGGLSFHPNQCVGEEAGLYKSNLSLYVNTGYPGLPYAQKYSSYPYDCSMNDMNCLAYDYGYNAGKYATTYALSHGAVSNNWWLDVETVNSWSYNTGVNISSLEGEYAAIKNSASPSTIGYYSYPAEWESLTNNWSNGNPSWVATDSNYKSVAVSQCHGDSFTGGQTELAQYISKLDLDLACK